MSAALSGALVQMEKSTATEVVASATIFTGRKVMISPGNECNDERD
jgi:hypothetical protein